MEVTLLGQNVNAYGKDFKDRNYKMENLLEDVAKTGIDRVRFVTSHPWDFTDNMIDIIKSTIIFVIIFIFRYNQVRLEY